MGALHEGHLELVRGAVRHAQDVGLGGVVVSIFVNPTQFNDPSDFERYPRDTRRDAQLALDAGATWVWTPTVESVYPPDAAVGVGELPPVATEPGLEDRFRPGHFAGVVQVVRRLFQLTNPKVAVFGEKDWQQLQVVRAMVAAESNPVEILSAPTVRASDGLAMASRNVFLSADERRAASAIPDALVRAGGLSDPSDAERALQDALASAGLEVEYAAVRDASTLLTPRPSQPSRALVAVRAGKTRLLDNAAWPAATLRP